MIGITERGDAALDRSWADKQHLVKGLILITKRCDQDFVDFVNARATVPYIIHATCTGYGGTIVEPNVPKPETILKAAGRIDKDKVVLRIDPIFLTRKGVENAIEIARRGEEIGFKRIRFSFLDMYAHVKRRFDAAGLKIEQEDALAEKWFDFIESAKGISFESCGESSTRFPKVGEYASGCVSQKDIDIMGIDLKATGKTNQRKGCLCCSQKKELLENKSQCAHKCIYCYWLDAKK